MFETEFSVSKKHIGFWLDQAGVLMLSPETKSFIATHAVCRACKQSVSATLQECVCDPPQRFCAVLHGGSYLIPREQGEALVLLAKRDRKRIDAKMARAIRKERKSDAFGTHTKDDILALWAIQNGECYFCGDPLKPASEKKPFAVDHLVPLASGGNEWPRNIALLCRHCNQTKHSKSERAFWCVLEVRLGADIVAMRKERVAAMRPLILELSDARHKAFEARAR